MLHIHRGQSNTVVLTLSEKCTLSSPVFLFSLTNDSTNQSFCFIAQDGSLWPDRYNQFIITEKANPDLLHGEIELINTGFYTYRVYEQSSSTNLDPDNATALVEQGMALVPGSAGRTATFSPEVTNKVFRG